MNWVLTEARFTSGTGGTSIMALMVILMLGFLGSLPFQEQASAQIALPKSVFGNGSTVVSSSDHKIVGTVAQPMIGEISSTGGSIKIQSSGVNKTTMA